MDRLPRRPIDPRGGLDRLGARQLDDVRIDDRDDPLERGLVRIGRNSDDGRTPATGGAAGRSHRRGGGSRETGELRGFIDRELARRPRHEVQANRVGIGRDRSEQATFVGDSADLDDRATSGSGWIDGVAARGDE